ncbi:IclR family transcriptional regulator [Nocardioides soli]|uniref:DNA-binding IclR family transcriptional regulator n=1 Tax=Nocardioides soli TaxID=1036020 RepID=A0A7W4Z4X3_9ACTN|nr:IclR family transcriptional regulator [Nocardioides soli]MBB3045346.1 DNA-binding IclR family transcriptional regulator [Nocardioides soli]
MTNASGNSLASVTNTLRLLSMLSSQPELRVVDVSRRLGIAPSTSHRLLSRLKEEGFMQQARTSKRYMVGPELLRLARHFSSQNSLERIARPHLVSLCRLVDEAVNLQILVGPEVLCLDAVVEDRHDLHVKRIAGRRVAAHASAAGKVLLAATPLSVRQALYGDHGLPAITARTIVDPDAFEAELAGVRAAGFATNLGEREDGVHAVAVPVLDLNDHPMAALAVAAPAVRLPPARVPGLVRDLRRARAAITAEYFAR